MKKTFIAKLLAGPVAALAVAVVVTAGLGALLAGCQKEDFFDPELPVEDVQSSFSKAHGLMDGPFQLTIIPALDGSKIYYTLDGSVPTAKSPVYKGPLSVSGTTIIRALERAQDGHITKVATASYIFEDVLDLDSTPAGYPEMWGPYCQIEGRAKADYAMDPLMTKDPALRQKMLAGLRQIPIVSIVTDKGNFFNDSEDPDTGGIYIHTGTPVGDGLGRGWDRPVSVEIFDGGRMDLTVDCGIRLHGGHSRLAEKNPKHAFRLKFKSEYGPSKLKYDIFGDGGPAEFNTLTLRTFFGNAWQHWDGGNRGRAQYVRDLWHRYASASLGMPYSRGRHVHVFINGMYWGIYSLSERIDENFCKSHFGGNKDDYDVIKVDEEQGNSAVADAGSFAAYAELMALDCKDMTAVERLLDVDEFIDFMILNQFAGNTDWDYHNWYGVYDRGAAGGGASGGKSASGGASGGTSASGGAGSGASRGVSGGSGSGASGGVSGDGSRGAGASKGTGDSAGFRFLVWDSECIFQDVNDNILDCYNKGKPTSLFCKLIKNDEFRARFASRVQELSAPGGLLTPERTTALWDSLYHSIDMALYLEAARWGDYRNAVHPYNSRGARYDVDNYYMSERRRLLDSYFPTRLDIYQQQLRDKGWLEE